MQALPSANIGLRLGNEETRLAVGLRLGLPLFWHTNVYVCPRFLPPDIMVSHAVAVQVGIHVIPR